MTSENIKIDTQSRTSAAGFAYSNSDPANSLDRTPTDFSYVDFSLANQKLWLESELQENDGASEQVTNFLNELMSAQNRRSPSYQRGERVAVSLNANKPAFEPVGGIAISALVFLTLMVFILGPMIGPLEVSVLCGLVAALVLFNQQDRLIRLLAEL